MNMYFTYKSSDILGSFISMLWRLDLAPVETLFYMFDYADKQYGFTIDPDA